MEQITGLEYSVQQAENSINSAGYRANDPTLLGVVRGGSTAVGLAGGVLGSYIKGELADISGAWASNSAAFVSLLDQFGSAVYNFGEGNVKEGFANVGQFAATGTNTIMSNAKFGGKQLFSRAGAWVITPTEIITQGVETRQSIQVANQGLEWAFEDIDFFSGLKSQRQGRLGDAKSQYAEHCE